jgi:hypothetical protein
VGDVLLITTGIARHSLLIMRMKDSASMEDMGRRYAFASIHPVGSKEYFDELVNTDASGPEARKMLELEIDISVDYLYEHDIIKVSSLCQAKMCEYIEKKDRSISVHPIPSG